VVESGTETGNSQHAAPREPREEDLVAHVTRPCMTHPLQPGGQRFCTKAASQEFEDVLARRARRQEGRIKRALFVAGGSARVA